MISSQVCMRIGVEVGEEVLLPFRACFDSSKEPILYSLTSARNPANQPEPLELYRDETTF